MANAPDGLSILTARREQAAHRGAPPPRHPRPVAVPTPADERTAAQEEAPAEIDLTETSPTPAQASSGTDAPRKRSAVEPKRPAARSKNQTKAESAPATSGLRAAQFYLDDRCDDYLRSIRAEALVRRLDVSGSAVVRFAIHRLNEDMTPEQVADRLAEPVADRDGTGRKRH
jgi:hypothetical protein